MTKEDDDRCRELLTAAKKAGIHVSYMSSNGEIFIFSLWVGQECNLSEYVGEKETQEDALRRLLLKAVTQMGVLAQQRLREHRELVSTTGQLEKAAGGSKGREQRRLR